VTGSKLTPLLDLIWFVLLKIYRGYVDDPRNTDNSWMETIACHFHDDDGTSVGQFQLHAGKWHLLPATIVTARIVFNMSVCLSVCVTKPKRLVVWTTM